MLNHARQFHAAVEDRLKRAIPARHRRRLTRMRLSARNVTASHRVLPRFLVIGAQRCGTSSLYKYLGRHPQLVPSLRKETEYFNRYFDLGDLWYRAHFPLRARTRVGERLHGPIIAFEATPDYLLDPRVPPRVAKTLPDARFIVLLRNPVARALSGWRHMTRLGFEDRPFDRAVHDEPELIGDEMERMLEDPTYYSHTYLRFSYLERGMYADQLGRWFDNFDRDNFLLIESERFYREPAIVYAHILTFLGVEAWVPTGFPSYSSGTSDDPGNASQEVPSILREELNELFAPQMARLEEMAGSRFSWLEA